jgi:hypothetical protein
MQIAIAGSSLAHIQVGWVGCRTDGIPWLDQGVRVYYRDMTRAVPTAAPTVDLSTADGAALDALTVYLMRLEHLIQCASRGADTASRVNPNAELLAREQSEA